MAAILVVVTLWPKPLTEAHIPGPPEGLQVEAAELTPLPAAAEGVGSAVEVAYHGAEPPPPPRTLRFAVLSDLHIRQAHPVTLVPDGVAALMPRVAEMGPELVVVTGDLTSGDEDHRFLDRSIDRWWAAVHEALTPFREAGIPVLPVPGNHDVYRPEQQEGFERAWEDLQGWMAPLVFTATPDGRPSGRPPYYYSVDVGDVHLSLLDVSARNLDPAQEAWIAPATWPRRTTRTCGWPSATSPCDRWWAGPSPIGPWSGTWARS
jgi:hypothetical protein